MKSLLVAFVADMDDHFDVTLGPDEIRALSYAVNEALRLWPGSPQRPAEEQELLRYLQMCLFSLTMELVYSEDGKRSEGEGPR